MSSPNRKAVTMIKRGLALSVCIWAANVSAGVQQELDQMFGSMTNVTDPGAYETARRGVLVGGSMRTRNKIVDTPIVNVRLPSAQGGCGGIDMFAGSFSFINADQFVQMLRAVAANATGYAFQLALSAMCNECLSNISTLQEKIQELNQQASNSCQLAQGLVNDTAAAFGAKRNSDDSIKSTVAGIADVFGSSAPHNNESGKGAREMLAAANKLVDCKDKGNVLWCAMQTHAISSYFTYSDTGIQEAIMSLTGSIIIGEMAAGSDNLGQAPNPRILPASGDLSLKTLLVGPEGGKATVYKCDESTLCKNPVLVETAITGLAEKITKAYTDPGGILDKFANNSDALTSAERALVGSTSGTPMGAMVVQLVQKNRDVAASFVRQYAVLIAANAVNDMLKQMLSAAQAASSDPTFPEMKQVEGMISTAYVRLNEDYQIAMAEAGGGISGMANTFNNWMSAIPATYTVPTTARTNNVK